jgi:hypothetical protein
LIFERTDARQLSVATAKAPGSARRARLTASGISPYPYASPIAASGKVKVARKRLSPSKLKVRQRESLRLEESDYLAAI